MARFGILPAEPPRIQTWDGCAPGLVRKVTALIEAMKADGFLPIVGETLRTPERVAFLHGFGREYDDGRGVVTNVGAASVGWHAYGLAADLWNGELTRPWELGEAFRNALGLAAAAHELTWGGSWTTKDYPHVQWAPMRNTPSDRAQALYAAGDIGQVWGIVGADT